MTYDEIGVTDEPVKPNKGEPDQLKIKAHIEALETFIIRTKTPLTIGIQGSWGTGKTSLLKMLEYKFEENEKTPYKQIWINAWEHSLLSSPEETLIKIIEEIVSELDTDSGKMIAKKARSMFNAALRITTSATLGAGAEKVVSDTLEGSTIRNPIKSLRADLEELINKKVSNNEVKKFVISVDDLDRIEPKNAVAILELLKNIFNIPHCVFLLAIDYDVVVKGLEHKFGPRTSENEYEFRAFFDKIIQLPFKMPTGDYSLRNYINNLLKEINFGEESNDPDEGLLSDEDVDSIVRNTIGGNPRSLKRLVNSLTLLSYFSEAKKESIRGDAIDNSAEINDDKYDENYYKLLFAILCLQIEFPDVYDALRRKPDIEKWDKDFAYDITNGEEERMTESLDADPERAAQKFYKEFVSVTSVKEEILKENSYHGTKLNSSNEDFNEPWELVLFRICYPRPRYRARVIEISRFLSFLKEEILFKSYGGVGITQLDKVLSDTSITSVASTGSVAQARNSKTLNQDQFDLLEKDKEDFITSLQKAGSVGISRMKKKGGSISAIVGFKKDDFPKELQETNFVDQLVNKPKNVKQRAWEAYFYGFTGISIYSRNNEYRRFMEFCKSQCEKLNEMTKNANGHWQVILKEQNQILRFTANDDVILSGEPASYDWDALRDFLGRQVPDNKYKKNAEKWLSTAVPMFEKEFFRMCKEYIDTVGDEI